MKAAGRRKLLWIMAMVLLLTGVPTSVVYATSTQEKLNQAQEDKKQTQSQLNETKDNLKNLKDEKNVLEGQLADLNEKLTIVSNNLNDLEQQISAKEDEIEITQAELEKAKETEQDAAAIYGGSDTTGFYIPGVAEDVKCYQCGKEHPADDPYCPLCGMPTRKPEAKRCEWCGETLQGGERRCPHCGAALRTE